MPSKAVKLPEWPHPVNYGKENIVESDVLVVGGGVAGCRAAIEAMKKARPSLLRTETQRHGGAGVDHWYGAVTNFTMISHHFPLSCMTGA
jgi:thioredoxin reductase